MNKSGVLQRAEDGTFVEGQSGNPKGRPKGSKNKITLLKLAAEEAFRGRNEEQIDAVLDMIVQQALEGDKASQKLIWDSTVSKSQIAEDKAAGAKQTITVHRMNVNKKEDNTDEG